MAATDRVEFSNVIAHIMYSKCLQPSSLVSFIANITACVFNQSINQSEIFKVA